jgi:hypothetical protein
VSCFQWRTSGTTVLTNATILPRWWNASLRTPRRYVMFSMASYAEIMLKVSNYSAYRENCFYIIRSLEWSWIGSITFWSMLAMLNYCTYTIKKYKNLLIDSEEVCVKVNSFKRPRMYSFPINRMQNKITTKRQLIDPSKCDKVQIIISRNETNKIK